MPLMRTEDLTVVFQKRWPYLLIVENRGNKKRYAKFVLVRGGNAVTVVCSSTVQILLLLDVVAGVIKIL